MPVTVMTAYRSPSGRPRRRRGTLGRNWVAIEVLTRRGVVTMAGRWWLGYFPWSLATSEGLLKMWPDGWSYEEVKNMKRKRQPAEGQPSTVQAAVVSKMFAATPHVVEHLAARQYDDGAVRQPGTMIVSIVGSMYKVVLKDPDSCQQMQVLAATLDDVMITADLLLSSDEAPWEPDPWAKQKGAQKSKK